MILQFFQTHSLQNESYFQFQFQSCLSHTILNPGLTLINQFIKDIYNNWLRVKQSLT